jgi:hypothetical protein
MKNGIAQNYWKKLDTIAWANFYDQSIKNNHFVDGEYEINICIMEIFIGSKFGLNITNSN